jgi:ribosome-binding ATPase
MHASIIGAQYSGKTLSLQALTGIEYPKKEEIIGTIKVPDERIDYLSGLYKPKKTTYAELLISDYNIPPTENTIISSKTKNYIQKSDLLICVLRNFDSQLSENPKNPLKEYIKIKEEIIFSDLFTIEKRLEKEEKEKKNPPEIKIIKKLNEILNQNRYPKEDEFTNDELITIVNFSFLSLKKIIVLLNQQEGIFEIPDELTKNLKEDNISCFQISATLENELNKIPEDERQSFLSSYGLNEPASSKFIKHTYNSMGLISFFTVGEDEVKAWSIKKDMSAQEAAGKIHSDIQRGFIKAEVMSYEDLQSLGSEAECKKAGKFRLEGKDYSVKDGDIISYRFNV